MGEYNSNISESSLSAEEIDSKDILTDIISKIQADCWAYGEREKIEGYCPRVFDGALCWPRYETYDESIISISRTLAGELVIQQCPDYIRGFDTNQTVSRKCEDHGDWYINKVTNDHWTNYTLCHPHVLLSPSPIPPITPPQLPALYVEWLPIIKRMSTVGYTVSFVTLIFAFLILVSIKKLRCPRNTLHMHLFISFMLKSFFMLLKHSTFYNGIGLQSNIARGADGITFIEGTNWECKLVFSLWQYFVVANYTWILMEGLYLHNLIFLALFTDTSSIFSYILLGWGGPLVVVGAWVGARFALDNTLCWTTNTSYQSLFWIIKIPIIITIVLNFIFFLNIVRVLFLKLQSAVSIETRKYRYRKWAKSTTLLLPLFGVHYMVFIGMSGYIGVDPLIETIWLFCDQFFASFQGFFVAILYCLINGEVRSELGRRWSHWRYRSDTDQSKNFWVPLNQISSKFYHRSTHEDMITNASTNGGTNRESFGGGVLTTVAVMGNGGIVVTGQDPVKSNEPDFSTPQLTMTDSPQNPQSGDLIGGYDFKEIDLKEK